ncbi:glycoside hydrolase family 16 protein [Nocardioides daejeonensis]|uniref:glycoside hydrolase family 16 protein n=1 Tax=Nocardioides daejeonensis TaxID=1046556 RepID=UPI000D74FDEF|nr:glycoside hydrolase family 16 protein [Nocardioides daejeonensis]
MRLRAVAVLCAAVLAAAWGAAPVSSAPSAAAVPQATAATARSAVVAPGKTCGGQRLTKPDGSAWVCTFSEEFDGKRLNRHRWQKVVTRTSGFLGGGECFVGSKKNVRLKKGKLRLTARRLKKPMTCTTPTGSFRTRYTSGSITTHDLFSQTYGRFQIRAKFPKTKIDGLQSAIWMTPQRPVYGAWPRSGEIDIVEHYTHRHRRAIPYLHYMFGFPATPLTSQTNTGCFLSRPGRFHTYVLTWEPGRLRVSIDGKACLDHAVRPMLPWVSPQPFNHPFVFNLTHLLGVQENAFDPAATKLPSTFVVDYWRAWR